MRLRMLVLLMLLGVATAAPAQINIGINFSVFPELVRVPNYPVYYAPRQNANYFFYDGYYWVYRNDDWYSSDWYNGPWYQVAPEYVPVYVLRVPVRYYRVPPPYFREWERNAPPRWGEHWGGDWERRRDGWDRWNRRAVPAAAPLPTYQRRYTGDRYPRDDERHEIKNKNYRYAPKDALVRKHVRPQIQASAPAARERAAEPSRREAGKDARERAPQRSESGRDVREREPQRQESGKDMREREPRRQDAREREQRPLPPQAAPSREPPPRPQPQAAPPREQPPRSQRPDGAPPGRDAGREQGGQPHQGADKGPERSRGKGDDGK